MFQVLVPHHVNEVGQDALHLIDVDVLHLHHPQSHQEGVQRQLVSPQQQIAAERRQQGSTSTENFISNHYSKNLRSTKQVNVLTAKIADMNQKTKDPRLTTSWAKTLRDKYKRNICVVK